MAEPYFITHGLRVARTQRRGKTIKEIREYSVAVDPPNQGAAGFFGIDVTVTGVAAGDYVLAAIPPSALEANLRPVGAVVLSANTIRLTLQALAAVDGASLTWKFLVAEV